MLTLHLVELDRIQDWLAEQRKQGKLIDLKLHVALALFGKANIL